MSRLAGRFALAQARARARRGALLAQFSATRDRVRPSRLIDDTIDQAGRQLMAGAAIGVAAVRAHPVRSALIGVAATVTILRGPLWSLLPASIRQRRHDQRDDDMDDRSAPEPILQTDVHGGDSDTPAQSSPTRIFEDDSHE